MPAAASSSHPHRQGHREGTTLALSLPPPILCPCLICPPLMAQWRHRLPPAAAFFLHARRASVQIQGVSKLEPTCDYGVVNGLFICSLVSALSSSSCLCLAASEQGQETPTACVSYPVVVFRIPLLCFLTHHCVLHSEKYSRCYAQDTEHGLLDTWNYVGCQIMFNLCTWAINFMLFVLVFVIL
ncbi:uncharacterized protein LOC133891942 isoform X2 [Phragmites australis]|uniref:uncharacterized protein LOC133891942 isoform X2 n=1 Tax=Phragmites australis TaxID=29695 RepID=UPI002D780831|nr:uncharacterized protein LOC133891942 isoform X2 [Phragmites australis]